MESILFRRQRSYADGEDVRDAMRIPSPPRRAAFGRIPSAPGRSPDGYSRPNPSPADEVAAIDAAGRRGRFHASAVDYGEEPRGRIIPGSRRIVSRRPTQRTVHVEGGSQAAGFDAVTGELPRPSQKIDPEIAAIDAADTRLRDAFSGTRRGLVA